jgi:gliding motility-associated-like protein
MAIWKINWLIVSIILLCSTFLEGRHIIGGEITYECLGEVNGQRRYKFTMRIYRDCSCQNCAQLDNEAPIAIYRCGVNQRCSNLSQANTFSSFDVRLRSVRFVEEPDFPCLQLPANICVEEGLYEFEVNLPVSEESYNVIYQRCCRNETISNIVEPGNAGATYSVEITPQAQAVCNNSPKFNDFPPTVICVNQRLEFNHGARDKDGDQLVYQFCTPELGGGRLGTPENPGNPSACTGVSPDPPCPPPYGEVTFVQPTYTFLTPLGGDPVVKINPNTGIITGIPTIQGQFVVGVCVSEYRNGILLSTLQRDFQFNVANCTPTVVADIEKDSVVSRQNYLINSCGKNTINFVNRSFQRQFVKTWEWSFEIDGQQRKFSEWDATVTFPDTGKYEGTLILNPNTECGDTANIFVNIFPAIEANFEFEYDTCVAGPVQFTDLSTSGTGEIKSWRWNFADNNTASIQNPSHVYRSPGDFPVQLTVTDRNRCSDTAKKSVRYFPVPALIVIAPSEFVGCVPAAIFFDNLSFPIDETYAINWNFGDGKSSNKISPTHTFTETGTFTIAVDITSPIGCKTDTTFIDLITTLPSPVANFSFTPTELSNLNSTAYFFDESVNTTNWFWQFSNLGTSREQNPVFAFPDTGRQEIRLIVTHPQGCQDSIVKFIDVIPEVRYFLPNAFTPDNDGSNDEYRGTGLFLGISNFSLNIWNRWGEVIFQTNNPEEGWNGKKNNEGEESPNGVYVCTVRFNGPRGERYEYKSFATLIR